MVTSAAQVSAFGSDTSFGPEGALALNGPIVGTTAARDGQGYWLVGSDGGIFAFGDASFYGSAQTATGKPVVGMAAA
jgi:hypothetical protein